MTSTAVLGDKTNALLSTFDSHAFKAFQLRDAVVPKYQGTSNNTENYTRFTQDMTGQSDSGLVVDLEDREKAAEDLVAFKDYVSTLKFAYLECNMKLSMVGHMDHPDGLRLVSTAENDLSEKRRLQTKAELRERKAQAKQFETLFREEAELLEQRHDKAQRDKEEAATVFKEIKEMEYQIALLKNKRDNPAARVTIPEAQTLLEQQDAKIATFGPDIKACEKKMKETTHVIRVHKSVIERLAMMKKELKKEEKETAGEKNEEVHEGCRWITNATELFSSLFGIKDAYAIGVPPTEMVIEYQHPEGEQGDIRTLSIELGEDGAMTGAKLVNSSDDIQDIVDAYLVNQDMISLVHESMLLAERLTGGVSGHLRNSEDLRRGANFAPLRLQLDPSLPSPFVQIHTLAMGSPSRLACLLASVVFIPAAHAQAFFNISSAVAVASSKAVAALATNVKGTAVLPSPLSQPPASPTVSFASNGTLNITSITSSVPASVWLPFAGIALIVLGVIVLAVVVFLRAENAYKGLNHQNEQGEKKRKEIAKATALKKRKDEGLRRRKAAASSSSSSAVDESSSSSDDSDSTSSSSSDSNSSSSSSSASGSRATNVTTSTRAGSAFGSGGKTSMMSSVGLASVARSRGRTINSSSEST